MQRRLDNAQFKTPSNADKRHNRMVILENNLKCMLIHDESSENTALALGVHAGNLEDPANANGVAHLLEHMLIKASYKNLPGSEDRRYA